MTQTGLSLGTSSYMSPEQALDERTIDARTDIYALGAVTYEMLVGDAPFLGSNVQAIVAKVLSEKPTPLHTLRDDPRLVGVVAGVRGELVQRAAGEGEAVRSAPAAARYTTFTPTTAGSPAGYLRPIPASASRTTVAIIRLR